MDERILKDAVGKIQLSDRQKDRILAGCSGATKQYRRPVFAMAAAACVCLLAAMSLTFWAGQKNPDRAPDLAYVTTAPGTESTMDQWDQMAVTDPTEPGAMDIITVNDWDKFAQTDMALAMWCLDPEICEIIYWNWEQAEAYFGREIRVDPVPAGLVPDPYGSHGLFIRRWDDGTIISDSATRTYWNLWHEDGSSLSVVNGGRGFSVSVCGEGINFRDCIIVPEDEMELSTIDGVQVLIGHRVMGTLYNENHEPEFTWDLYMAQFEVDGIGFEVVAEAMTLDELVSIIKNLIP